MSFGQYTYLAYLFAFTGPLLVLIVLGYRDILRQQFAVIWQTVAATVLLGAVAEVAATRLQLYGYGMEHVIGVTVGGIPFEQFLFYLVTGATISVSTLAAIHEYDEGRYVPRRESVPFF